LILAAQNQGIEHVYHLTNSKLMLPKVSSTFHGRDIFAPAAAYLEKGVRPAEFGPEVKDPMIPPFVHVKHSSGSLIGEVLDIDGFGNIITNINEKGMICKEGKTVSVELTGASLRLLFGKVYAQAKRDKPILLIGSHGFLEIALNQASAAEKFGVKAGDKIKVTVA